jgi:hypothetical protein
LIWSRGLELEVEIVQQDKACLQAMDWTEFDWGCASCLQSYNEFDVDTITQILNALIHDDLRIRKYGRLLGGVGIKRDGSGDIVTWDQPHIPNVYFQNICSIGRESVYPHGHVRTEFAATNGGQQLRFLNTTPSFTTLPDLVRENICRRVIASQSPIHIDLDAEHDIPLGLLHLNKDTCEKWRKTLIMDSDFHLALLTTEPASTFSDFQKLARLLRKPFDLSGRLIGVDSEYGFGAPSVDAERTILEDSLSSNRNVHIRLNFNLDQPIAQEDLRISALPLILETLSTPSSNGAAITITHPTSHGSQIIHTEQHLPLRTLRYNVTVALRDFVAMQLPCLQPEIWINGCGEVVEVKAVNGPLVFKDSERLDRLGKRTVKDLRYRESYCSMCTLPAVFPFENSAQAALNYLCWVLRCTDAQTETWCLCW